MVGPRPVFVIENMKVLARGISVRLARPSCRYLGAIRWNSTNGNRSEQTSFEEKQKIGTLPSEKDSRRSDWSRWASEKLDQFQATLFTAGRTLNDITGYSSIERLKKAIDEQENYLRECKQEVRKHKEEYTQAISRRSASQREVNELLQRKHSWSPSDLERFTELYRNDHANEQLEAEAEARMSKAEHTLEDGRNELARLIGARYHEEQIWSDKIRRASTYGTWGLMAFNVLLFIVVQLGLEPWKRRRLVGSFEDKVKTALDERLGAAPEPATPEVEEPTSVTEEKDELDTQEPVVQPILSWRTFPSRVVSAIEHSTALVTKPSEVAVTVSIGASIGALLGSLLTLAFNNR